MPSQTSTTSIGSSLPANIPSGNTPEEIRARIPKIRAITEQCYMQLAYDLWSVHSRKLYVDWGFKTFDDYTNKEVGISKDRAYRLRRIFTVLVLKCGMLPSDLAGLGRSKAERLLPVVTRKNASRLVKKAKSLPYGELVIEIEKRKARQRAEDGASTITTTSPNSTVAPVKLAKASSAKSPRIETEEEEVSEQREEFRRRHFSLPPDSDELLDEALAEAQRITKSASEGFNLTCIVQHFLAHRLTQEGRDDGRLGWFMGNFERIYGGRLLHIKDDAAWEVLRDAIEDKPDLFTTSDDE